MRRGIRAKNLESTAIVLFALAGEKAKMDSDSRNRTESRPKERAGCAKMQLYGHDLENGVIRNES